MDIGHLIVCPQDLCGLHEVAEGLVSECGIKFKTVNEKPILISNPKAISLREPDLSQVSENVSEFIVPSFLADKRDARILHLGSGNVKCDDPRVVSTDLLPNKNVDLVCEGENLPFLDQTFDYVTSGAVLEHVSNPIAVAAEMRRVLKVGGTLQSTVAFNQPYHGFPSHYFNWSPIAMETYLLDDYELIKSGVAQDGTLAVTLTQSWDLYLEQLPTKERETLLNLSLKEALGIFRGDRTLENPYLARISRFAAEQLCSAYEVIGIKRKEKSQLNNAIAQSVYEERRMVLLRLQEIDFYSLKLFEKDGTILQKVDYRVRDIPGFSNQEEALDFLKLLQVDEKILRSFRDEVITKFLA